MPFVRPVLGVLLVSWTGAAFAGPVFGEVGDETPLDLDGNWPRAFPGGQRGGFVTFGAGGGDFKLNHADSSLKADHYDDRLLTGRTDLKDHDIRPCPDGTWLHTATGDTLADHDSAWVWRYDADFRILAHETFAEASTDGSNFVDLPVVCGPEFQGFAYAFPPGRISARFAEIGPDAASSSVVDLRSAPFSTGSSLINDSDGTLWMVGSFTEEGQPARKLLAAHYDADLTEINHIVLTVAEEGSEVYWPQATIRVGDVFIVAHMLRDSSLAWTQQEGDIALTAFDVATWAQLDQVRLSNNVAPTGGMQPFVVFDGRDGLVALYSKELKNYSFRVTLQPAVLGQGDDTGTVDTGTEDTGTEDTGDSKETGEDTSDPTPDADGDDDFYLMPPTGGRPSGCGCASGAAGGAPALGVAWVLARGARGRRAAGQ